MAITGLDNVVCAAAECVVFQSLTTGKWTASPEVRPDSGGLFVLMPETIHASSARAAVRRGVLEPVGMLSPHCVQFVLTEMGRARARVLYTEHGEPIPPMAWDPVTPGE